MKDNQTTQDQPAKPFDKVLQEEMGSLSDRRRALNKVTKALLEAARKAASNEAPPKKPSLMGPAAYEDIQASHTAAGVGSGDKPRMDPGIEAAHHRRPLGVCLSGGGIRSATFNLGVIQGLCQLGLLPYIDYLSTVSGGGFIGSWLHGVIRKNFGNPAKVQDQLKPGGKPGDPEDDPVTFLRKYSNYLAPSLGLLSADTWTIAGVWLRNMALNLLILIPFLASVVLLTRSLGMAQLAYGKEQTLLWWLWPVALVAAVIVIARRLWLVVRREFPPKHRERPPDKASEPDRSRIASNRWSWAAVILAMVAAYILGAEPNLASKMGWFVTFPALWLLFLILQGLGGFAQCFWENHKRHKHRAIASLTFLMLVIPTVCAVATSGGMILVWGWLAGESPWIPITIGPGLMILIWTAGVVLQIGLMGADFPDTAREWLTQFGSLLGITVVMWTGAFALSVYGPLWLTQLALWKLNAAVAAVSGWVISGAATFFSGTSSKTKGADAAGAKQTSLSIETVASVAPPIFMALTLLLVSFGAYMAVRALLPEPDSGEKCVSTQPDSKRSDWLNPLVPVRDQYWCSLSLTYKPVERPAPAGAKAEWGERYLSEGLAWTGKTPVRATLVLWLAGFIVTVLLSLRFNINEFSMHHFYKNRLVRCYLGAGNAKERDADPLTGFDPKDDFKVSWLQPKVKKRAYYGPYPIVNCALNLNTGSELATAERKACSFVFTPKVCGFEPQRSKADKSKAGKQEGTLSRHGYRDTDSFMLPGGPGLGTAMAISGAAANPNWGYHTSTAMAFLLTVFDVRLGWWVGNPRRAPQSRRPGPKFALLTLLAELFAQTDSRSRYVNLSDGGHFENLGLYELIRRRCRYIIAGDAEEDHEYSFEALGGAIRRCRADFGVEIDINVDSLRPSKDKPYSAGHCVVGTIRYPEPDQGRPNPMCQEAEQADPEHMQGWLVYFKASMTGDEPEDIQQYQGSHPVFPHEPTSDQFFTESQFESYRRLGEHVVAATFERIKQHIEGTTADDRLLDLFQDLYRKWHPAGADDKSGNFTERYNGLMDRLASDADLEFIGSEFFPGRTPAATKRSDPFVDRKTFYYCLDAIQLMEDVFFELFTSKSMQFHPEYAGWMTTFRVWAASSRVQKTWSIAKDGYSRLFQEFLDELVEEAKKKSLRELDRRTGGSHAALVDPTDKGDEQS